MKIRKTGNSLALTIPQEIINSQKLKEGDWVDIHEDEGMVIFTPVEIIHRKDPHPDKS